jgi:hypothetical protein
MEKKQADFLQKIFDFLRLKALTLQPLHELGVPCRNEQLTRGGFQEKLTI